ncbi:MULTISPECIES: hypothetical protein [Aerosakkonema]
MKRLYNIQDPANPFIQNPLIQNLVTDRWDGGLRHGNLIMA